MQDTVSIDHSEDEANDDADLMRRIAGGDQEAFRRLMRRHLARTVRLAARILGSTGAAEDVAQEAFIRVWQHAPSWEDPGKAGAKFSTWLYRIVLNLCIDEKRKFRFVSADLLPESADESRNAEQQLQSRETTARVRAALETLPDRQRAAFVLCFYEEYSNKDAAEALGIGVKAVESLLVRARRTLRDKLKGDA